MRRVPSPRTGRFALFPISSYRRLRHWLLDLESNFLLFLLRTHGVLDCAGVEQSRLVGCRGRRGCGTLVLCREVGREVVSSPLREAPFAAMMWPRQRVRSASVVF